MSAPSPTIPHPTAKAIPSLSYALANVVQRATERSNDGQRIYGPIATLWEEYIESDAVRKLLVRLRYPLTCLCKDISATANRHFNTYIKGSHPPRPIKDTPAKDTSTTDTPTNASAQLLPQPLANIPLTYTQAATTALIVCESTARERYLAKIHLAHTTRPDTRLFACIGPDHSACKVGAFAILTALKE